MESAHSAGRILLLFPLAHWPALRIGSHGRILSNLKVGTACCHAGGTPPVPGRGNVADEAVRQR